MKKKIEKFEELIAWQKARKLTAKIYRVTNEGSFAKDYGLKDQVRRAAVSSMSNMAEGFERGSLADLTVSSQSRRVPALNCERSSTLLTMLGIWRNSPLSR